MTNRELPAPPEGALDGPQRQRRHALRVELAAVPCPACLQSLDALRAAGVDIDAYSFDAGTKTYRCPGCGAELEQVVPLVLVSLPWHWALKHSWLTDRLRKADLYDRQHQEGKSV